MQHPYYTNPDKFKPNASTIKAWLKTRKNNNSNKPGIFETVDYYRDQKWSLVSIFIELAAFAVTFYGAYEQFKSNGDLFTLILALFVVLLFVAFDIIGIMLHGEDKPKRTKDKSEYLVTIDPNSKREIYERLKVTTWKEFLGFMLLCLSAVLKILALYWFFQRSNLPLLIVFTITYILVIYIHSYHTVYWWPARRLKKSIKKQSEEFEEYYQNNLPTKIENTIDSTDHIMFNFQSKGKISGNKIEGSNEGRIFVLYNGGTDYTLHATGLLWDENIVNLAGKWENEFITDLIHACIKVQLLQLDTITN
jgi:hypothetical protein